ncbi:MAG: histidine--tRNA ligase [Candidatus Spechtbacterales bacterium]
MAKPKFQNVTGMPDILPKDRKFYDMLERVAFKISSYYGYERIETPVVEYSELFEKGTGQNTDIVEKQMYNFTTEGGDRLTLRPEFTPSIVRAYIQHGMASWPQPVKVSTIGPLFRHEKPQSGRFREFRQFEIDSIGEKNPILDAQVILIFFKILEALSIKDINIHVNSIGCSKCKPVYRKVLRDYYRGRARSLCKDCRKRKKVNVLRLLDCKDEKCERLKIGSPEIVDHICEECRAHLRGVLETLDYLTVPYMLSPHLVRGIDYYTKTVFEMIAQDTGAEDRAVALVGGGRFDGLVNLLGGQDAPAVGASLGIERTIARMRKIGVKAPVEKVPHVFFVHLGDLAKRRGMRLMEELRVSGIFARESLGHSSIKSQMALADKMKVEHVLILGHQEVSENTIIIRDMQSGSQEVIPMDKAIKELKRRLKK